MQEEESSFYETFQKLEKMQYYKKTKPGHSHINLSGQENWTTQQSCTSWICAVWISEHKILGFLQKLDTNHGSSANLLVHKLIQKMLRTESASTV